MNANQMRKGYPVILGDDVERVIYPVSLKQLRKLRTAVAGINFDEDSALPGDETIDAMVKATAIVLEKVDPELAGNLEEIEDIVDLAAFNVMLTAAMGADPNE